jgi:Ca2+-transporting ATPase
VLRRPPRDPAAGALDRGLATQLVGNGLALAAVCLAVAAASAASDGPWQTQLFITLAAGQLALALALRPSGAWTPGRRAGVPWLPIAVAANLVLLAAAVLLPGLGDLLGTERISVAEAVFAVGAALVPAALVLLIRAVRSHR